MIIKIGGSYKKDLEILLTENPELRETIDIVVKRFVRNYSDTRLYVHPLQGKLKDKYALSVTDDIRIIFHYINKHCVIFLAIGPHVKVYPGYKSRKYK